MTGPDLTAAVARAAGAISTVLADHPPRAGQAYPITEVLPELTRQHEALRAAVDASPDPPGLHPLGQDVAALMCFLELVGVLYLRLDELPDDLRGGVARNLSTIHRAARKLRDQARH